MISLRYYLDTRALKADGKAPMKLAVTRHGVTALLSVGLAIAPEQWSRERQCIVRGDQKAPLNRWLTAMMLKFEDRVRELALSGELAAMDSTAVRDDLRAMLDLSSSSAQTVGEYGEKIMAGKSEVTARVHLARLKTIGKLCPGLLETPVRAVSPRMLTQFEAGAKSATPSYRNMLAASLGVVLNAAVREGLIAKNPFSARVAERVVTHHRDLTVQQLHDFFYASDDTRGEDRDMDLFKFSFYARGMNLRDMLDLTGKNIEDGRIVYNRSKTGTPYSVKIQPEMQEIMDRWKGQKWLFDDMHKKPYTQVLQLANHTLKRRAKRLGLPPVTPYWARHSFASVMLSLGYTADLVSAALGHQVGAKLTGVYLHVRDDKVDEAQRAVIDAVKKNPASHDAGPQ